MPSTAFFSAQKVCQYGCVFELRCKSNAFMSDCHPIHASLFAKNVYLCPLIYNEGAYGSRFFS